MLNMDFVEILISAVAFYKQLIEEFLPFKRHSLQDVKKGMMFLHKTKVYVLFFIM